MNPEADLRENQQKDVYYDGSCPLCTVIVSKIDESSQKEKFNQKDITRDSLPPNITEAEAEKEIYVIDSDGKVHKNIDALLKILEEYPRWTFLSKIGRLPIIKQLLSIGYKFVAANRRFLFGQNSRVFYLKLVVVLGLMSGLFLSTKLWVGDRLFPLAPMWSGLLEIPHTAEVVLFAAFICLLVLILLSPKPQKIIFSSLLIAAIFVVFDQMRLQPWFFQYFFMLLALGLFSWNHKDTEGQKNLLNASRLIIASIYFFSGLQKINIYFIMGVFPWMVGPIVNIFPESIQPALVSFGIFVPLIEIGIGIGLLTKKYKKLAIIAALMTHGFILFSLGPLVHNWNSVVWPWNIAMPLFVLLLFYGKESFSPRAFLSKNYFYLKIVIAIFVIMPFFSFFNLWDSYLSSALYSGNMNRAYVSIGTQAQERLPEEMRKYISETSEGDIIDLGTWSFAELNVPVYPETRVYKIIGERLCADIDKNLKLVVLGKQTPFKKDSQKVYDCLDL